MKTDPPVLRYIIEEGLVAIDGVSLAVTKVHNDGLNVSIMPHTMTQTILPGECIGDIFGLENDCIARYVERLLGPQSSKATITIESLAKYGF